MVRGYLWANNQRAPEMRRVSLSLTILLVKGLFVVGLSVNGISYGYAQNALYKSQNDRLERLERDIRYLNIRLSRGSDDGVSRQIGIADANNPPTSSGITRLGVRIDRFEEDIRVTTGSMEEINYRITKLSQRLDKLVTDMDFRLSSLEAQIRVWSQNSSSKIARTPNQSDKPGRVLKTNGGSLGSVAVSEIEAIKKRKLAMAESLSLSSDTEKRESLKQKEKGSPPSGTPKEQYQSAFRLLQQADYDLAEKKLREFINRNQDSPLVENARYWLGETYYVRKIYEEAAQVFFDGYQASPKGTKAADSLLKLGMSLSRLGKKQEACTAFSKLIMDFKRAPERIKKTLLRESSNNNCS